MRTIRPRLSLVGLLQAAATVTAVFSVATFADSLHRYLELFSHFRLQYLVVALLLCLAFIAIRRRTWASLMLVITAINVMPVATWYFAEAKQTTDSDVEIKMLQANVWGGNTDTEMLIELIAAEQPDIVILQEVTNLWVAAMDELQAVYPHRYEVPRNDAFGIAIYSREPLLSVEALKSPPFGHPSLFVRQSLHDTIVTYVSTHPIPPIGKSGFDARNEQLASIAEVTSAISGPTILVGDLNTTMWGHHYDELEDATGLVNARRGFGVIPTWPTQMPFAMIPIDHCLVSDDFAVRDVRSGSDIGSDHLPLIVELLLP